MLLNSILWLGLAVAPTQATPPAQPSAPVQGSARSHGSLDWFRGSYEELGAKARTEQRAVMIYLWTDACTWSRRLEREALSDPRLAETLSGLILWNVDLEQGAGKMLGRLFGLGGTPVLLFFDTQGAPVDRLDGYRTPAKMLAAVEAVVKHQGTLSDLRAQLALAPADLELRTRLIAKLDDLGALDERDAELELLRKLDTQRKSLPMRREVMAQALSRIEEHYRTTREINPGPLVRFLESERHPELLFEGYAGLAAMHDRRARELQRSNQLEAARSKRADQRAALAKAAPHLPDDASMRVGFAIDTLEAYLEFHAELNAADRALLLELTDAAVEILPDDPRVQACCAAACHVNGDKAGASAALQRSFELDPQNPYAQNIAEWMKP